MANALMTISENQKVLIFDYKECIGGYTPISGQDLDIYINPSTAQNQLEFLYDNKFKINGADSIYTYKDASGNICYGTNTHTIIDASDAFNQIITFSVETFEGIDKVGGDFKVDVNTSDLSQMTLYFVDNVLPQYTVYDKQADTISSNMESFMLLRTNPKLTGNIKLVVTEDYNLYLDTFKVSTTSLLNKMMYRHKAIPDDGNYPYDVYKVFRSVPKGEMYRIYDDSYDPHKNYYDPNLQVENIYEYGAEYNNDKLYSENMKILAPLYIGKHVPTYFAIFKTDILINKPGFDNTEQFNKLIQESECVKIYDLRQSTSIGKYLNNYKSMITKYLAGTCALQFIEQDYPKNSSNYRQGKNTWKGIVYDRGIFADMTETSYFANQILSNPVACQEKYNWFLLNGYSRNNILYPNILNLEFMFNDPDADNLSMHNYFGLYLTENDFVTFNQVIKLYGKDGNTELNYYNEDNKIVNINDSKVKILDSDEFDSRIFFGTTLNDAAHLKGRNDFNIFMLNYVANQPYENIAQLTGRKIENSDDDKSFMTLSFEQPIQYGEHFKFINNYTKTIYEVVASNDQTLTGMNNYVSQFVQSNIEDDFRIFRTTFYTQDIENPDMPALLSDQVTRLFNAINKFHECIKAASVNENTVSITADKPAIWFQHILSGYYTDNETVNDTIKYFNFDNVYECHKLADSPIIYNQLHKIYANNKFDQYGDRYTSIVRFMPFTQNIYELSENIYSKLNSVPVPLVMTVYGYYPVSKFTVNTQTLVFDGNVNGSKTVKSMYEVNCLISPYDVNKCIIMSAPELPMNNDIINICSPIKSNIALMGINQIKDIDMYVNINEYYRNESVIQTSFYHGETVKCDNSDGRIHRYMTYTLISGHISGLPLNAHDKFMVAFNMIYYTYNGSVRTQLLINKVLTFDMPSVIELSYTGAFDQYSYDVYKPFMAEDNFYTSPLNTISSNLDIPLVPMVNCQWKSTGTYFDTLSSINTDTFTNYLIEGNFIDNIYMPDKHNNQYISSRLSDIISVGKNKVTVKDFIMKYGYKNAIRKYLSTDFKIDTAIGYYNSYVNSLEFIYYGVKFIFKLTNTQYANEIKLNEYDNYEVFVMNDYNALKTNEIYISKNEEFILIINHAYRTNPSYVNGNIKKTYNDIEDVSYSWYTAPFNYDLIHTSALNNILTIYKSNYYNLDDYSDITYTVEIDLKNTGDFDDDNAYFAIDMSSCIHNDKYDNFLQNASGKYDFLINDTNNELDVYLSDLQKIFDRYGKATVDYRDKHTYIVKSDNTVMLPKTYADKLNDYIESFDNDIELHIINNDECETLNINDSYRPLTLTIQKPNQIKFNQGLFDPLFVDIFNFELNDDISDVIGMDTLYANTKVKNISSIRNVYYNKIMNANKKCDYNYFCKTYQSPLSTDWDNNIYRLYDDDTTYTDTYGYMLGITDKMMFGSKCLVMHDEQMTIDTWDYPGSNNNAVFGTTINNQTGQPQTTLVLNLNITDTFYIMLSKIKAFRDNWQNISAGNMGVFITNYINNTLSKFYDINKPEIELYGYYDKSLTGVNKASAYFMKSMPKNIDEYKLINNANTQLYNVNGKIMLTVTIQDYKNTNFYPVIKINKI